MRLFVLRHGIAAEPGEAGFAHDADRPLTSEGKVRLKALGAAMRKLEIDFDLVLSSPYKRAQQTAEIVAQCLDASDRVRLSNLLEPAGDIPELIEEINGLKPRPENILLVGHEPHLSELISILISGQKSPLVMLKKGALAKLYASTLRPGRCALLKWLLTPKQMELIAGTW